MEKIKTQCPSCGGTGLYRGMAEPKGTAVVCLTCNGSGCKELTYEPFRYRIARNDVQTVSLSRGSTLLGCGAAGRSITYEQFCRGEMPTT